MILQEMKTTPPDSFLKEEVKNENKLLLEQLINYQKQFRAEAKNSLLIILQGMDASGKSGATRTLAGIDPSGINVTSFKKPTEEEFAHDFLWRIHQHVPQKGMIQIFDRSHYEDILVPSVEGYFLEEVIQKRYAQINNFEQLLVDNNTTILKFYLHVSKKEQETRLKERIDNPEKQWKHNDGDWDVREKWDQYMAVYEQIFANCNTIPWQIIPSNKNWYKQNIISKSIIKAFDEMDLSWPKIKTERF